MRIKMEKSLKCFTFHVDEGDDVVLKRRNPTTSEKEKYLRDRYQVDNDGKFRIDYAVHREFADLLLVDVEGMVYEKADGTEVPLTGQTVLTDEEKNRYSECLGYPINTWKDFIPDEWKRSILTEFDTGVGKNKVVKEECLPLLN